MPPIGRALEVAQATESLKLTCCSKRWSWAVGKTVSTGSGNHSIDHGLAEPFLQRYPWLDFLGPGLQRPAGRQDVRWWAAGGYLET